MNRLIILLSSIFFITLGGCGGGGGGGGGGSTSSGTAASDITLAWTSPSTNTDGSDLEDLTGYKIYFGQVSGTYTDNTDIGCNASCECDTGVTCTYTVPVALLGTGTWCFVITAYDSVDNESESSEEKCRN